MPKLNPHYSDMNTDPFRNFKFQIEIDPPAGDSPTAWKMGFMSASGFSASHEVIPYREGGANTSVRKLPGQTNFSDITLTNGITYGNNKLWQWFQFIFDVTQGNAGSAIRGNPKDFRAHEMSIRVLCHPANDNADTVAHLRVKNVWPTNIAFSDLDAGGNAILVQQIVLAHEGWSFDTAKKIGQEAVAPAFRA